MIDDWQTGLDQLADGEFWEAHESWEAIWRDLPDSQARPATQALIQFAAACYKVRQTDAGRAADDMQRGMAALIERARNHLDEAADLGPPTTSWPTATLREAIDRLERILEDWRETDDLAAIQDAVRALADDLATSLTEYDRLTET